MTTRDPRRLAPVIDGQHVLLYCSSMDGPWRVARKGHEIVSRAVVYAWARSHRLHTYELSPEDEGDAREALLAPFSGDSWA